MQIQFKKRLITLCWYLAMQVLSFVISLGLSNIDILSPYISPAFSTVLGLILAQISKELNNYISAKKQEWQIK